MTFGAMNLKERMGSALAGAETLAELDDIGRSRINAEARFEVLSRKLLESAENKNDYARLADLCAAAILLYSQRRKQLELIQQESAHAN